jgi:hypothetical protein
METEEPETKKAKVDEEEAFVEKEGDAKPFTGKKLGNPVGFETEETTLNVVPSMGGKVLTCLSDGGASVLLAAARANVGLKAGRYLYEVQIIENLNKEKTDQGKPLQFVKIGFSTAGSSLLGDGDGGVFFDSNGTFHCGAEPSVVINRRFAKGTVIGVLLNLDPSSPNANTISLFRNGERYCPPKPLSDGLKGKALYPHVCFKNVTMQVHFGPTPLRPLPFKCRCLNDAGLSDVVEAKKTGQSGKCEVVLPVGIPDEGTFEWLDSFLEKNPQYTELSDRKLLEWAKKSGQKTWEKNKWKDNWNKSNDRPDIKDVIGDDVATRQMIASIAAATPRNYVVMEVKQNLIPEDRAAILRKFPTSSYVPEPDRPVDLPFLMPIEDVFTISGRGTCNRKNRDRCS